MLDCDRETIESLEFLCGKDFAMCTDDQIISTAAYLINHIRANRGYGSRRLSNLERLAPQLVEESAKVRLLDRLVAVLKSRVDRSLRGRRVGVLSGDVDGMGSHD